MSTFFEVREFDSAQDKGVIIARFHREEDAKTFIGAMEKLWYDKGYQYSLEKKRRTYL